MFLWGTGPHCPVSDMCNLPDLWAVPNVTETEGGGARVPEPPASRPGSFRGALSSLWEPSQFPSARTCSVGRPWQVHCVRDEHFRASSLGKWWDSGNQRAARKGDTVGDVLVASGTVWCLEKPTLLTLGSPSPKRPWSPPPIASHSPRMAAWGMLSEFRLKYLFVAEVSSQPLLSGPFSLSPGGGAHLVGSCLHALRVLVAATVVLQTRVDLFKTKGQRLA